MPRYKNVHVGSGKSIPEHRAVWEATNGPIPKGIEIHHINGNGRDNRLENLVALTHSAHVALHKKLQKEGRDVVDPSDPDVVRSRELKRDWNKNNRKKLNEMQTGYYREDKERYQRHHRKYYLENKTKVLAKNRAWAVANKEKTAEYQKQYYEEHKTLMKARARLCEAKKKGMPIEVITKWQTIVDLEHRRLREEGKLPECNS